MQQTASKSSILTHDPWSSWVQVNTMKIGVLEQLKLSISEAGQLLGLHGSKLVLPVFFVVCFSASKIIGIALPSNDSLCSFNLSKDISSVL